MNQADRVAKYERLFVLLFMANRACGMVIRVCVSWLVDKTPNDNVFVYGKLCFG